VVSTTAAFTAKMKACLRSTHNCLALLSFVAFHSRSHLLLHQHHNRCSMRHPAPIFFHTETRQTIDGLCCQNWHVR
jgi:hypothetical protein